MKNSIQEVLDRFDFDKVHAYMELTKWRYFDSPNTPTIETLKRVAKDLLTQVEIGRIPWTMTGGFKASILDGGAGRAFRTSFRLHCSSKFNLSVRSNHETSRIT